MSDLSTANEIDKTPQKSSNSHDTENDKESNGKSSSVIKSPRISSVAKKHQKVKIHLKLFCFLIIYIYYLNF